MRRAQLIYFWYWYSDITVLLKNRLKLDIIPFFRDLLGLEPWTHLFPVSDVLKPSEQEDTLALGFGYRLHDPRLSRILLKLLHENVILRLKYKKMCRGRPGTQLLYKFESGVM